MTLISTLSIKADAKLSTSGDLGTAPQSILAFSKLVELASGTAVGQADRLFYDRRTLIASATEDLDLSGALLDVLGGPAVFAEVHALLVAAPATNTNNVIVGAASAAQWATLLNAAGTITLRPGDCFAAVSGVANATGWPVTATTADLLKVANSAGGTPVDYDIVIIGTSA